MTKLQFKDPLFIKSAFKPEDFPHFRESHGQSLPEIAVVGRSNVGKSSLLNHLFQKDLVKTSSTPGKTQAINFFTLNRQLVFVDLPGYGYAKVPTSMKQLWGSMIEGYLDQRVELRLILMLLDIRHTPTKDDFQFIEWLHARNLPSIIILTKTDKLNRSEKEQKIRAMHTLLPSDSFPVIPYSVHEVDGRKQLIQQILTCLN